MTELAAKRRRTRGAAVVLAATVLGLGSAEASVSAAGGAVAPAQAEPATVFDVSRSLGIEAARTRLRLFVNENPEQTDGAIPVDLPECPLLSVASFTGIAGGVASARAADLRLQLDPWLGRTASDPELRPDFAPEGQVAGIPIVRCDSGRPEDPQLTRPSLFAINLTGSVTFDDVVRLYNLSGVLTAQPAGIGGVQIGSCLATDENAVCVVLWSSRGLVIGVTLEGPSTAVSTATAGALLTSAVPAVIDSLAVVTQPAPVCSAETLRAETGVALLGEPLCADGWAFGTTVECPPPTTTTEVQPAGLRGVWRPGVVLANCQALDVFHVQPEGWVYDGSFDTSCTETFARLGMTVVTASEVAPEPCDDDDPALRTGSIRPGRRGTRVAALQVALVNLGYVLPVDGRYGPLTESAVVDFQVRNGLIVDGIAGSQTRTSLGI